MRAFFGEREAMALTHTFEDLHGLNQLPGLAPQRLMADGMGFAGEGDWRTAALVRALMVMGHGLSGAASFIEDYTYHLPEVGEQVVLGSHMLEICPSIASGKPRMEIHPLGIGGKSDPVRLVFDAVKGQALNASLVDLGNRFRLVVNEVGAVEHPDLPRLPVARTVWRCKPDFATACAAWIHAGGAHHTAFSHDVTTEMLTDFGKVLQVLGDPADPYTLDIQQGFEERMAEYPDVEIISLPAMQWEASNAGSIVADQLLANPDIDLIFVHAAHLAVAAVASLEAAGKQPGDVLLVSSNGAPVGLDLIRQGWEQVEVEQPLYAQAAAIAMFADKLVNGEEIEPGTYDVLGLQSEVTIEEWGPSIKIPGAAITPENVDDPRFWGNLQAPEGPVELVE